MNNTTLRMAYQVSNSKTDQGDSLPSHLRESLSDVGLVYKVEEMMVTVSLSHYTQDLN